MQLSVSSLTRLWFGPGDPVRAASAVTRLGDGWLVAQDDANHAGWWRAGHATLQRLRLLPPHDGSDVFDGAAGGKRLKPDLEAACSVAIGGEPAVLLLGSGSLPPRRRAVLVREMGDGADVRSADLTPLYARIREMLGLREGELNLEGACVIGDRLRWFQRGHGGTEVASASVDLDLAALMAAVDGTGDPAEIEVGGARRYDLGDVGGLPLAITDAVTLPDGRICVSATAEDAQDAIADGPVMGSALVLLGAEPGDAVVLPLPDRVATCKVEGIALVDATSTAVRLLAVVDDDDPRVASLAMHLILSR